MICFFRTALVCVCLTTATFCHASSVFINEFHYDNSGGDINEGIEIAGLAGTDLSGWHLLLYNGSNGAVYNDILLQGVVPDQQSGFGTLFFALSGIQNGPDGFALTDDNGQVVQFLSYEGSFTAMDGAAAGLQSVDVGVFEESGASADMSLQLAGVGISAADFVWVNGPASAGAINIKQQFGSPVPLPATLPLLLSAFSGLCLMRKKPRNAGVNNAVCCKPA